MQVWSPNRIFSIDLAPSTPRWKDWAALRLFSSGVGLLRSSICSINCLNAQLVSGSRPASSPRCSGDASRETAGPPAPLAEPLMVIVADRPDAVKVRKWCAEAGENGQKSAEEGKTLSDDIESIFLLFYLVTNLLVWKLSLFNSILCTCKNEQMSPSRCKTHAAGNYSNTHILSIQQFASESFSINDTVNSI